jgi:hypothetical protein
MDPMDHSGVFRNDGTANMQLARSGETAPDGNGRFSSFSWNPQINDAGQVAFSASLIDTVGGTSDGMGIFFFDETHGVLQIARTGDSLLGSTIADFGIGGVLTNVAMNKAGVPRIAYRFNLADGRGGIAVWSLVPEPGGVWLVAMAVVGLARWRQRRRC